jgi:hypothetical protein
MTTPFVIDNQKHKMTDVLDSFLAYHKSHALDIATTYFNMVEQRYRLNSNMVQCSK